MLDQARDEDHEVELPDDGLGDQGSEARATSGSSGPMSPYPSVVSVT